MLGRIILIGILFYIIYRIVRFFQNWEEKPVPRNIKNGLSQAAKRWLKMRCAILIYLRMKL